MKGKGRWFDLEVILLCGFFIIHTTPAHAAAQKKSKEMKPNKIVIFHKFFIIRTTGTLPYRKRVKKFFWIILYNFFIYYISL